MKYVIPIIVIGLIFLSGCITFSVPHKNSIPKVSTNTPLEKEANSIVKPILEKVYGNVILISSGTSTSGNSTISALKYKVSVVKEGDLSKIIDEFKEAGFKIDVSSATTKSIQLIAESNSSKIILVGNVGSDQILVAYQNLNKWEKSFVSEDPKPGIGLPYFIKTLATWDSLFFSII